MGAARRFCGFQDVIARIAKSENRIGEVPVKEIADLRAANAGLHREKPAPA